MNGMIIPQLWRPKHPGKTELFLGLKQPYGDDWGSPILGMPHILTLDALVDWDSYSYIKVTSLQGGAFAVINGL